MINIPEEVLRALSALERLADAHERIAVALEKNLAPEPEAHHVS